MPEGLARYLYSGDECLLFAHLVDAAGRQLGNAEADRLFSDDFYSGDLLATFYEYTLPAERGPELLWVDLGAFRRYGREGLPWTDGGEHLPSLKVGPLKVAGAIEVRRPPRCLTCVLATP